MCSPRSIDADHPPNNSTDLSPRHSHLELGETDHVIAAGGRCGHPDPVGIDHLVADVRQKLGPFSPKSASITIHSPEFSFDAIFNATGTNKKLFLAAVGLLRGFATVVLDADGDIKSLDIATGVPSYLQFHHEAKVI